MVVETASADPRTMLRIAVAAPLREQVAERLRDAIAQGTFRAGERLRERDLCALLGVSRTSVREALRQIESEGLVTNIPNRGPIVSEIDLREAQNLYETRAILEGLIARLFARRASGAMMAKLKAAFEDMSRAYASRDVSRMVATKSALYGVLIEGSENGIAGSSLKAIHIRSMQLRSMSLKKAGRPEKSLLEIKRLVRAVHQRDEDAAWAAGVDHVRNAAEVTLKLLGYKSAEGDRR